MCARVCARVCARERCPQQGTGRDGRVVAMRTSRCVHVERVLGQVPAVDLPGGHGEMEPSTSGCGQGAAGSTVRHGAARHGTARLCVFLHTPRVSASVQPRSPPSRQQMFGAERASTRPTFHAGRETPSSAKVRTKLPPKIGLASSTEIMGRC